MRIEHDTRTLTGEHNGWKFTFEDGLIEMFGRTWDKSEIKALLEVANLLRLEGFEMVGKRPPQTKRRNPFEITFGYTPEDEGK